MTCFKIRGCVIIYIHCRQAWKTLQRQVIILENAVTADHKRHAIDLKMLQGEKINSDLQREPLFESHKGRHLELQVLICG